MKTTHLGDVSNGWNSNDEFMRDDLKTITRETMTTKAPELKSFVVWLMTNDNPPFTNA